MDVDVSNVHWTTHARASLERSMTTLGAFRAISHRLLDSVLGKGDEEFPISDLRVIIVIIDRMVRCVRSEHLLAVSLLVRFDLCL